jgi:ethanolamine ammonia-lyase small subunit
MSNATPTRPSLTPATTARLSLGNTSPSLSTSHHLRFQLDHALARDAVHTPLDIAHLEHGLRERGLQPILLRSAAPDRRTYLRRPDLGRTLHRGSVLTLQQLAAHPTSVSSTEEQVQPSRRGETPVSASATEPRPSILFLLADGLSALALERHALPLLDATLPLIPPPSSLFPVLTNARVAIADSVGHLLGAQITILLIGERPGLSSPDSLGCYITWNPRPGRTDAERNCISNIRGDAGLSYAEAAHRIAHYLREAHRLETTGTTLKDPTAPLLAPPNV